MSGYSVLKYILPQACFILFHELIIVLPENSNTVTVPALVYSQNYPAYFDLREQMSLQIKYDTACNQYASPRLE